MTKVLQKIGLGATMALAGLIGYGNFAHATEMTGLAEFRASSTSWISDNTGGIIQAWMLWAFAGLGIGIIFILVAKGSRGIKGSIGGGRRRRR